MRTRLPNNLSELLAYEDKIRRAFGRLIGQHRFQFARVDWRANLLFNKSCALLLESMREEFMITWIDTEPPVWRRLMIASLLEERSERSTVKSASSGAADKPADAEEAEFQSYENLLLQYGQDILSGERAWLQDCPDKPWNMRLENQRTFEEAMKNPLP